MITDDIRALRDQVAEHEELLDLVATTLKTHAEHLSELGPGASAAGTPAPASIDWRNLDADTAAATWEKLLDWADWLAGTFPVADVLPACWARHPALLWDVSALYLAHTGAYAAGEPSPLGPLMWIEQLERAVHRWRLWDQAQCASSGRHRDDHTPMRWPGRWRDDAEQHTAADIAARPASDENADEENGA